jgi:myo-inositol-1(or 4)-monophosphatase
MREGIRVDHMPSIRVFLPVIEEAAQLARSYYRHHDRLGTQVKPDQTVVTVADRAVEALLRQAIAQHCPDCNVIGEEDQPDYDPSRPYTFIIDPIDGTMSFVNDTPSWTICLGVLDQALTPVAGIICAPAWESLYLADFDPDSPALLNDRPLPRLTQAPPIDSETTLLVDSKLFRTHYMHDFSGRCRGFGSAALHICLVAQQRGYAMAYAERLYAWDLAGAHAIAHRVGLTVRYIDGTPLDYAALLPDKPTLPHLVTGHPSILDAICPKMMPLPPGPPAMSS